MKTLRIIGGIVAFILLGFLIFAWFLPSEFKRESNVVVQTSKQELFEYVRDMNTWSKWQITDTNIVNKVYKGENGEDSLVWTGQAFVSGSIVIDSVAPSDYIRLRYNFTSDPEYIKFGHMYFDEVVGGTKLSWRHKHDVGWNPILRIGNYVDKMWNNTFDSTLVNLKTVVEIKATP